MSGRGGEEGAALLAVLMLVAVMAAVSVVALEKMALGTRTAGNAVEIDQARAFALGSEAVALGRIGQLLALDRSRTTLAGGWADRPFTQAVPGGLVTARLSDGGNCFNLNSVVEGSADTLLAARPVGIAQFVALMQALDVPLPDAQRIADGLADWIDSDAMPRPAGAEDEVYSRLTPAYRTANTLVADRSELRAVAGVTPALYDRVAPFVCALPTPDLSPLNVNTLTDPQAPLVAMLAPGQLDLPRARAILAERPAGGFDSVARFWRLPALDALVPPADVVGQPRVTTRWFALALDVELGRSQVTERALIDASANPPRVARRSWGDDE